MDGHKTINQSDLTKKFIRGLEKHDLTCEKLIADKWKYCGGNQSRHLNYFKLLYPTKEIPEIVDRCI